MNIALDVLSMFSYHPPCHQAVTEPAACWITCKGGYDVGSEIPYRVPGLRWTGHVTLWLDSHWPFDGIVTRCFFNGFDEAALRRRLFCRSEPFGSVR